MSANLLLLNSYNTDFLLIGLPKQLSKLNNPTMNATSDVLSPVPQARNLGVLFDSNLSLLVIVPVLINLVSS
jgi:cellulose biosynthesis protein BcsQ